MMNMQSLNKAAKKIANFLLLSFTLNILSSAYASAATLATREAAGSFNQEVMGAGKIKKEPVSEFYVAFLKNLVERGRLEEKEKQALRQKQGYDAWHPEQPKMFEVECIKLLMRYFDSNESEDAASGAVFSANVHNDLGVFPSSTNYNRVTVFSDFSHLTSTMAGKLGLLEMLGKPLSDIEKLNERQRLIEHLVNNPTAYNELDACLEKFGKAEKSLLYFMKTKDDGNDKDDFRRYFDKTIPSGLGNVGNNAAWYTELGLRALPTLLLSVYALFSFWQLGKEHPKFIPLPGVHAKIDDALRKFTDGSLSKKVAGCEQAIDKILRIHKHGPQMYYDAPTRENKPCDPKTCSMGSHSAIWLHQYVRQVIIAASFFGAYKSWYGIITPRAEMGKRFQSCMIDVVQIVDAAREIAEIVGKNDTLATAIPGYKEILNSISGQDNANLKPILEMFDSQTLRGDASAAGPKGQVFSAFRVMCEKADKFTELMRFVSRLDAIMSVVRALKASAKNAAKYSIPKFIKAEDGKPYLCAKKFWHPTLNPTKVITNDIELGKSNRCIILTGANAGGKTTWMQGLALVAVLAQTFGIVPAESATLTPFSLIIADTKAETTIGKESMYQNEVKKLTDASKNIQALRPGQVALYIADEPLKGSNAQQCSSVAYDEIRRFGLYQNALVVVATHFEELIKLGNQEKVDPEIRGVFTNYKVDSRLYECEKYTEKYLHHTYKVVPGIITEVVTKYILDEEFKKHGLSTSPFDISASNVQSISAQ